MAVKFRDYYEVLGVPRTATPDEIKKAYRKLARQQHPDLKPPGERAQAERFKEINEAYEVLKDPEKRSKYDTLGANWKGGMDYEPPPGSGPGPRWSTGQTGQWEDVEGFSDFFASLFGSQPGARGSRRAGRTSFPGSDVEAELPVTVEDLLRGGRRRITINDRSLDVDIPLGARDDTVLRLAGQGGQGVGGGASGDLYLRLRLVLHPRYRVQGDDLELDLPLWPWQAVLGASVRVETPDGPVTLKVPPGTQSGSRLRLKARGLPRGRDASAGRGDLYAVIRIVVPENPNAEERSAYEALKRAASAPTDRPADG